MMGTTMDIGFALIIAFAFGLLVGLSVRSGRNRKEFKLLMSIQLDATQPVVIKAVGKDSEGNTVDLTGSDLTVTAEGTNDKTFGEINDANDTFNPGEAGATGIIRGSVTINETPYTAEVEVELVPGGLAEIALEFSPSE